MEKKLDKQIDFLDVREAYASYCIASFQCKTAEERFNTRVEDYVKAALRKSPELSEKIGEAEILIVEPGYSSYVDKLELSTFDFIRVIDSKNHYLLFCNLPSLCKRDIFEWIAENKGKVNS